MGMMSFSHSPTNVRCAGLEMVPLKLHCIEPGLDEWIASVSDEDKYARLFEVCASFGYMLTIHGLRTRWRGKTPPSPRLPARPRHLNMC